MTEEFNKELQKQTQPKEMQKKEPLIQKTGHLKSQEQNEKSKESLQYLQNTIKRNNICIMEISGEEKERDKNIFKAIMVKNFPNFWREMGHPDP